MIFQFEALTKAYGIKKLFTQINGSFTDEDRIGLIGINGAGKSTFLKVISGIEQADSGQIMLASKSRIVYLHQDPPVNLDATILETIFESDDPIVKLIKRYEATTDALEENPQDEKLIQLIETLTNEMTQTDAWAYEREVKSILHQLGIHHLHMTMGSLSGGLKKRVALAKALVLPSDLLVLDEPTNHLDANTIEWLEQHLRGRKGGLLMVTHDRYFLDRVVNRIFELDGGRLFTYTGHYSDFLEQKLERERREAVQHAKDEKLYQQELAWMRAGVEARRTKQQARKQRFEILDQNRTAGGPKDGLTVDVAHSRLGKTTVDLGDVGFYYEASKPLFTNFEFTLLRSDRVGIVGENGAGKTTLIKIMTGELAPTSGDVRIGQTVKVGHFRQEAVELPLEERAINYIKNIAELSKTQDGTSLTAAQMLERFLFTGEMQWSPISKLSGGERKRLYLLGVLMGSPNILVLDEPTNDLDLATLGVLEAYLDDFPGAVIIVSHDRYFLDRTCERLLAIEEKRVNLYTGNYTDYREKQVERLQGIGASSGASATPATATTPATPATQATQATPTPRKGKLSFNEQREYDGLDAKMETMMEQLDALEAKIGANSHNYMALSPLIAEKDELEMALLEAMERKAYLDDVLSGKA